MCIRVLVFTKRIAATADDLAKLCDFILLNDWQNTERNITLTTHIKRLSAWLDKYGWMAGAGELD